MKRSSIHPLRFYIFTIVWILFLGTACQWDLDRIPPPQTSNMEPIIIPNMILVETDTFIMGNNDVSCKGCNDDEFPEHKVYISKDYYISEHEITIAAFEQFVVDSNYETTAERLKYSYLSNGNRLLNANWKHDQSGKEWLDSEKKIFPVLHIAYQDAIDYCSWLSKRTGEKYRLPTEAEWEFAAGGGKRSNGYTFAGSNLVLEVANILDNTAGIVQRIKKKAKNELGIYDMSGNAYEWCLDYYDSTFYFKSPLIDPRALNPVTGKENWHILRGGTFDRDEGAARIVNRGADENHRVDFGFRIVREK